MPGLDSDQDRSLPPTDLLQSWKEIAAYLDATERSAQRWEQLEGLPVHRQIRNKRSAVYAYKSEIEEWRRSRSLPPGVKTRALIAVAITFPVSIAVVDSLVIRAILVVTGVILAIFLARLPTRQA